MMHTVDGTKLKILHLEDVQSDALLISQALKKGNIDSEIRVVDTKHKFTEALKTFLPDVILAEHSLPSFNSFEALAILQKTGLKTPFILITGTLPDEFAVNIIKKGAEDYILKDRLHRLPTAIHQALEKFRLEKERQFFLDELLNSELHLKEAQAIGKVGSWVTDLKTYNIKWSEGTHQIFETDPKKFQVTYESFLNFIHPDDRHKFITALEDSVISQADTSVEHRIISANGTLKHVIENWKIFQEAKGHSFRAVGTCHDITERKIAEQEKHSLHTILQSSLNEIYIFDSETLKFSYANKGALLNLGYSQHEIKELTPLDIEPDFTVTSFKQLVAPLVNNKKEKIIFFTSHKRKDGSLYPAEIHLQLVTAENDKRFLAIILDITKRKKAEEKLITLNNTLTKSEKMFQGLIENSSDLITLIDENLISVYRSPSTARIFGWMEEDIKAKANIQQIHPEDLEKWNNVLKEILANPGKSFSIDLRAKHREGHYVWLEGMMTNMIHDEFLKGIISNFHDVTERKLVEERLTTTSEELRTTSERLQLATTSVKMGIWEWDIVNDIITWDNRMYELYGIEKQHFTGVVSALQNGVHPDDFERVGKELNATITGIRDFNSEFRIIWPDKSVHFIEAHGIVSRDENGVGIRMIGGNIDVTERKKAEKDIIDSEEKRRLIMSGALDAIICINTNDSITFWNPQAEVIFGWKEAEVMGQHLSNLIIPEPFRRFHTEGIKHYLETGIGKALNVLLELKAIRRSGEEFPIELTVLPIKQGIEVFFCAFVRDITKRKKADENNRFKANLLNTIGQAAVATDMNGIVNYWNNAAEQIYGWTQEEAIGKKIIDLTPSQVTKEQALQIMEHLKQGQQWSGEFRVQRKDGTDFPAWVTDAPIYDNHQNLTGIIGISSDITVQKKLQELLNKTNKLARIGNYEVDVPEKTIYWSDVTKEIHEVDKDFVPDIEKGISFYKDNSSKERLTQAVKDLIEKNIPYDLELEIVTAKGNDRWIRIIGQAEFIEDKCVRHYGSFQDIDKVKKAEIEVLKVYEERNVILESIGDAFFAVNNNWVVTYWNKEAEKMLLVPKSKIIGQYLWKILADNIDSESYRKYHEAIETNQVIHFEDYYISLNRWFDISAYPSENGLSVFFKDITQQKKSEEERLKITADLIQRNNDLEQFSYIVSHNLRSPVANIVGLNNELSYHSHTAETKTILADALSSNVKRLETVIIDLNTILQTKREITQRKEEVIFSKLVHDIQLSINDLIKNQRVHISADFTEIDNFSTIKSYMQSIFYNLISNSIKYRRPNVDPLIEISSHIGDGKLFIIFKDNGSGIDLTKKGNQIFGLYKRFHSNIEGKGMGLYMVKTQVETLGGKISVTSEVGNGTEFTIEFEHC